MSYFVPQKQILGDLKIYLAIEMRNKQYTNTWQIIEVSNSTKRHADNSGNQADLGISVPSRPNQN